MKPSGYFKGIVLIGVFHAVWGVGAAFGGGLPAAGKIVPERIPALIVRDLEEREIDLPAEASKNRALLVNFWGVRCADCITEMEALDRIYRTYRERKLEILAINVDGIGSEIIVSQLKRLRELPMYRLVQDPEFLCPDRFGMTAAPLTILFDGKGQAVYRHEGFQPGDEKALESEIEKTLVN